MSRFKVQLLMLVICSIQATSSKQLPSGFTTCKRNAELNQCLKDAIQIALPLLAKDIPDLQSKSIDPLIVDEVNISIGTGAFVFRQRYIGIEGRGFSKMKVNGVKAELDDNSMHLFLNTTVPKLELKGKYEFDGKLIAIALKGNGKLYWRLDNTAVFIEIIGQTKVRKNKKYMIVENVKAQYTPSYMEFKFDNIFAGNEAISNRLNDLLNENWKDVNKELQPGFIPVLQNMYKSVTGQIFSNVPYDELFLPA